MAHKMQACQPDRRSIKGHVNPSTHARTARSVATPDSLERSNRREERRHMVHDRQAWPRRGRVVFARHVSKPPEGCCNRVITRSGTVGPRLPEARHAHIDQTAVYLREVFVSKPPSRHGPRPEVLHENVSPGRELP